MSAHHGQTAEGAGSLWLGGTCRERCLLGLWGLEGVLRSGPASLAIGSSPSAHLLYPAVGVFFLLTSAGAIMLELIAVHSLFAVSPFPAEARKRSSFSWGPGSCPAPVSAQLPCPRGRLTQASPGAGSGSSLTLTFSSHPASWPDHHPEHSDQPSSQGLSEARRGRGSPISRGQTC